MINLMILLVIALIFVFLFSLCFILFVISSKDIFIKIGYSFSLIAVLDLVITLIISLYMLLTT